MGSSKSRSPAFRVKASASFFFFFFLSGFFVFWFLRKETMWFGGLFVGVFKPWSFVLGFCHWIYLFENMSCSFVFGKELLGVLFSLFFGGGKGFPFVWHFFWFGNKLQITFFWGADGRELFVLGKRKAGCGGGLLRKCVLAQYFFCFLFFEIKINVLGEFCFLLRGVRLLLLVVLLFWWPS